MDSRLIVMLTHNDQTVKDAIETFDSCKDLPVTYWGFKDIGLPVEKMKLLVKEMKNAGKTTCLEVVTFTEEECLFAAELAVNCEFDYLMGTIYYDSVFNLLKNRPIKYFPFCGKVSGNPSILEGSIDDIISEAKKLKEVGVDGFDLLAYRYVGDVDKLMREFLNEINIPVVIAGSINNYERIDIMNSLNPWGFTMGSALFNKNFVRNGSFRENLERVIDYINKNKTV